MNLSLGIVGLPNVGKSSLFQALTKKTVDIANYPFATIEPNIGIVPVPDARLERLRGVARSAKTIPAIIEIVDIAGLVEGAHKGEGLGNKFLHHIREVHGIIHLARAFRDNRIIHVSQTVDPLRDIDIVATELLLKDLEAVSHALVKKEKEAKSGDKKIKSEYDAMCAIRAALGAGRQPDRQYADITNVLGLLSAKPVLYVLNGKPEDVAGLALPEPHLVIDVNKALEDARECAPLITQSYTMLGLITFFTAGEKETRAWTIPAGWTAKKAGSAIHSDFEERFIRAQVIAETDFVAYGSWFGAKTKGKVRTEGKNYIVQDGDVIEFKI